MRCLILILGLACLLMAPALTVAQQATPAGEDTFGALFVQIAASSTLAPLETPIGEATHELILQERSDKTVFFADRPHRQVGTLPTSDVLEGFATEPENPPNAALVALNEAGEEEIIVLALLGGQEDAVTGELVYQLALLADFTELEVDLVSEPVTEVTEACSYGATSLFIDDFYCIVIPETTICWGGDPPSKVVPYLPSGHCSTPALA